MVRDLGELPFDGCDLLTGCRRAWGGEEIRTLTGQVEFSPDGRRLLVTEKTTNLLLPPAIAIASYRVRDDGLTSSTPRRIASHGLRPFSLVFREEDKLVVAESFNAAPGASAVSSYRMTSKGSLRVISGSVPNRQTDVC